LYDNGILNDPNNPELYYHDPSNGCVPNGISITFNGTMGSINPISTTLTEGQNKQSSRQTIVEHVTSQPQWIVKV
jgi:hypothetical protein